MKRCASCWPKLRCPATAQSSLAKSNMSPYKGKPSSKTYTVEIVVPKGGLGRRLEDMHDFHRQRAITDHYVPGRRDRERDYIRWFFEELATAEAFAAQFSGTLVTPHSEPAAWGVRIDEIANAVALRAMRHARLWGVRIGEIANAVALRAMRHARLWGVRIGEIANAVALRAMRHARLLYVLVPLSLIVVGALVIKRPESVEKMDAANADAKIQELKISREQQTQDSSRRAVVSSARVTPDVVRVIDGDTIRIGHQKPDIRLVGFNAPETRRAQCKAERRLGDRATARLRDLVQSSKLDFEFVACSCPPGTEGTSTCNYKRRCGTLKANGQDVGSILIQENLAVPFVCGQTRCPPTPKPWCR